MFQKQGSSIDIPPLIYILCESAYITKKESYFLLKLLLKYLIKMLPFNILPTAFSDEDGAVLP